MTKINELNIHAQNINTNITYLNYNSKNQSEENDIKDQNLNKSNSRNGKKNHLQDSIDTFKQFNLYYDVFKK